MEYEKFADKDKRDAGQYELEISNDRPIYEHFKLYRRVLDCGGLELFGNFCLMMLNSFPLTHGWLPHLPTVKPEKHLIAV